MKNVMSRYSTLFTLFGAFALLLVTPRSTFTAGSVTSQGDSILRADQARATFGVTGSGVKVGVISDGISGLDQAKDSGDLPAGTCGPQVGGVTTVSPDLCKGIGRAVTVGAEGTTLMEVIHDLAPGAELLLCTPQTRLDMVECINFLSGVADVIMDDLGFFAEPYFADGLVAQAAADAAANGVVYISAAGNEAETHYQGLYDDSGDGRGSHQISPGNTTFTVTSGATVFLQWSNEFGSSGDDYDLCFASETPEQCASVSAKQNGDDDPVESGVFSCTPSPCQLQVRFVSGSPQTLEVFVLEGTLDNADASAADSVFGHPAAAAVLAAGAINADDPDNDTVEAFSSRGPATIVFPTPEVRQKPNLLAIDGVSVSGAGGFPASFLGTSAAAPHLAAVAALMLEVDANLSPAQVQNVLHETAAPLGSSTPNFDSGFGRVDAFAAVQALFTPAPALDSLSPSSTTAGGPGFTLTVTGSNFVPSSLVRWNGADRATTFVSSTQLQATITASDIAAAGTVQVTVFNPAPGGGASNALPFIIDCVGFDLTGVWQDASQVCEVRRGRTGCKVTGTFVAANRGNENTRRSSLPRFYLSDDTVLDGGDKQLRTRRIQPLGAGQIQPLSVTSRLSTGRNATGKRLIAVVDATGSVAECNEANNTVVSQAIP